jgi:hypothetical protein
MQFRQRDACHNPASPSELGRLMARRFFPWRWPRAMFPTPPLLHPTCSPPEVAAAARYVDRLRLAESRHPLTALAERAASPGGVSRSSAPGVTPSTRRRGCRRDPHLPRGQPPPASGRAAAPLAVGRDAATGCVHRIQDSGQRPLFPCLGTGEVRCKKSGETT